MTPLPVTPASLDTSTSMVSVSAPVLFTGIIQTLSPVSVNLALTPTVCSALLQVVKPAWPVTLKVGTI